jgi:hypothetical protein
VRKQNYHINIIAAEGNCSSIETGKDFSLIVHTTGRLEATEGQTTDLRPFV